MIILVLNVETAFVASTKLISCEEIKDKRSSNDWATKCFFTETTVINSPGFKISAPRDTETRTIAFPYNKNIEYLPDNVYQTFPNLKVVDAAACAIKNISSANFVNLKKLVTIFLDGNFIEQIESGTFQGLVNLERIFLSKTSQFFLFYFLKSLFFHHSGYNRIKFIGTEAFDGLTSLKRVDLFNNKCISVDFNTDSKLQNLIKETTEKCQNFISSDDACKE